MAEFRSTAVSTTSVNVKTTGADIIALNLVNLHSAAIFVKIYDMPVATFQNTPFRVFFVGANLSLTLIPGDSVRPLFATSNGFCVRVTTGGGDTDNTAAATLPIIGFQYN